MSQFSALLIGNESLTAQCGDQLLAAGHRIAAVATRNPEVRRWAEGAGLRVEAQDKGLPARLVGLEVEWLFSVANLVILPPSLLALPKRGAVNFHDGLLPARAGLNAPVWAIAAEDAEHGITWHMIDGGVDEGDVLAQVRFPIASDDTALTLNTRCFEAAIDSFPALMRQLAHGVSRQPQDLTLRNLHLRDDRPAAFGRLDFTRTAAEALRLIRALDHGQYWNPLTTAKIATPLGVLNLGTATLADGQGAPGQVLEAGPDGMTVAFATGALRLSRLTCQTRGMPLDVSSLAGMTLPNPDAVALTAAARRLAPDDGAMRAALRDLQPATLAAVGPAKGTADMAMIPLDGASLAPLALALSRMLGEGGRDVAFSAGPSSLPDYVTGWSPLRLPVAGTVAEALDAVTLALKAATGAFACDLLTRDRSLAGLSLPSVAIAEAPVPGAALALSSTALQYDRSRVTVSDAETLAARLQAVAAHIVTAAPETPLSAIPALTAAERDQVLDGWNQTLGPRSDTCVHTAFEAQVARTPDAIAVVFEAEAVSYAALNARANRLAHVLIGMGVQPGTLVGLCLKRSMDLIVGALAIQKAGGAYVPMDPSYPADRIALFVEDSAAPVIVTDSAIAQVLGPQSAQMLAVDTDLGIARAAETNPASGVTPADLAYVIYTSGSTGRPKGVMVEHRNVANFFAGMDQRIGTDRGVWLAVTSLSFDISVLELFWTLARGFKVVLSSDENRALVSSGRIRAPGNMDFSIYYWGNDDGTGAKKYELLLEGAKFADANGFCAVWTPERHFHAFGGPYPNPAVTGAAVAAVTKNIGVRAGSCVIPLHHPARIAEEWAVIDNLTNGRAGIAIASGWHPDDFVLRPENTPPNNKKAMFKAADQVRRLWRGEAVEFPTAKGTLALVSQPRPVSKELPLWVTTAGNPETWKEAGQIGANILTHLLGQSIAEVQQKIGLYHQALRDAGHDPARHTVTLMLHTYIAADRETARAVARAPMKDYLRSAAALIKQYAWAFPAFKRPQGISNPMEIDIQTLAPEELDAILDFAFERYFEDSGLFGTIEDALARVEDLKRIGVGEVACLIDYGIDTATVLEGLRPLAEVLSQSTADPELAQDDFSIAAQILRHGVTHLQCTPSMARMIAMNDDSRRALASLTSMMLGGETLPEALVRDLRRATKARILNMYGPTETTIWSSTEEVGTPEPVANIGRPLVNQQMYVLDEARAPVAPGEAGELWIGGDGVARGYWQRPELTADRFRPDPYVSADRATPWGARMYRTGDLVRCRADGRIDFLGRADHQVKLRGYRIELGEIEAVLEAEPGVRQAVVLAREDQPGDLRLVAYFTGDAEEANLRKALAALLPAQMLPAHYVALERFPLTPNRKVDRKALPAPSAAVSALRTAAAAPAILLPQASGAVADVEAAIAAIWSRVLGVAKVGPRDNFFALGGHSLLAVQVHREIRNTLGSARLSITDIFRFPVLGQLAAHLGEGAKAASVAPVVVMAGPVGVTATPVAGASDRADARADAMARRRAMRAGRMHA